MHNDNTEPMEVLKETFQRMQVVKAPATQDICDLLNSMSRKRYVLFRVVTQKSPQTISTYTLKWITPYRGCLYKVSVHELPHDIYLNSPISFEVIL